MAKHTAKLTDQELREKILEENRKVHARESALYLARHPEQTNCYQDRVLQDMIARVCSLLPGGAQSHILDLGCGTGYLYLPFLAQGYQMQGVDLSAELICILEELIPQNLKPNSHLQVADVLEFAERDKALYDAVALSALLHHLFDYDQLIKAYCRKVKPGGVMLIFFEPLKQAIASPMRYALHKWLSRCEEIFYKLEMAIKGIPLFEEDYRLSDYQRQFGGIDPVRLIEVARNEGMEVLELKKYCARRYGVSAFIANQILGTQNTFNLLLKKPG